MTYTDGIHLVADSLEELHEFASSIGIKRCWFHGMRKGHPHYDLPKGKRDAAFLAQVQYRDSRTFKRPAKRYFRNAQDNGSKNPFGN